MCSKHCLDCNFVVNNTKLDMNFAQLLKIATRERQEGGEGAATPLNSSPVRELYY